MDHAAEARSHLEHADINPDWINDTAREAQLSALLGIGHALLAVAAELADIQSESGSAR